MSRTFSMNSGSVESLKVSARCGCRPEAHHGALRQTTALRHRSAAPVRGRARRLMQGFGNHPLDQRIANRAWRAGAWFVEQSFEPRALKAPAPLAYGVPCDAQLPRNLLIGAILLTGQHDPSTQREGLRGLVPSRPLEQSVALFRRQSDWLNLRSTSHRISLENPVYPWTSRENKCSRINDSVH